MLSSDSERTRETWALMEDAFDPTPVVSFHRDLYLAGPRQVEERVERLPDDVHTVMVLGHNFGWQDVVEWLCGDEVRLTTANATLLSAPGATWVDAIAEAPNWKLHAIVRPRDLED